MQTTTTIVPTEIVDGDVDAVGALNLLLQESEPFFADFLFVRSQDPHERLAPTVRMRKTSGSQFNAGSFSGSQQ